MIKSNTPPESITRRYIAPLVRVFVLAAFLVTAVQTSVLAGTKHLTLVNRTGKTITAVYCAPVGARTWGGNRLSQPFRNNTAIGVKVNTQVNWCLKIVFSNGVSKESGSIDVSRYSSYTIW